MSDEHPHGVAGRVGGEFEHVERRVGDGDERADAVAGVGRGEHAAGAVVRLARSQAHAAAGMGDRRVRPTEEGDIAALTGSTASRRTRVRSDEVGPNTPAPSGYSHTTRALVGVEAAVARALDVEDRRRGQQRPSRVRRPLHGAALIGAAAVRDSGTIEASSDMP